MFGMMNALPIVVLAHAPDDVGGSLEGAVAKLLDVTEHPAIARWVQFPKALLLFLLVPGDPESGAFYVYDRRSRVWFWVDFDDEKFGGYNLSDFDRLVRDCRFLDLVERPQLFTGHSPWVLQTGSRPQRESAPPGGHGQEAA